MKKLILLVTILCLSSCVNKKANEEFQFFSLNERNKPIVKKSDIYLTKVTRFNTFDKATAKVVSKYNNKVDVSGSWSFVQKPSKTLKEEMFTKAIDLGANYIIMFEKTNCDALDIERGRFEFLEGTNCYRIDYYNLPEEKTVIKKETTKVLQKEDHSTSKTLVKEKEVPSISQIEEVKPELETAQ
ncbi:MAG: hypothetical protein ACJA02_000936 [Myxococcota bacterium]|jgi:hypothetical protein